jgi:hypothetical protein
MASCQNNQRFAISKQNPAALKSSEISETLPSKIRITGESLPLFRGFYIGVDEPSPGNR